MIEPRTRVLAREWRARVHTYIGVAGLLVALVRRQVDEVWIGDSHAVMFNTARFPLPVVGAAPERERLWTWHLGPRLMHSVSVNGFPGLVVWTARVLRRLGASRHVSWFVTLGEIDVRCHLAPRLAAGADLDFVADYVRRVDDLAGTLGLDEIGLVAPPPPALDTFDHVAFPVAGAPAERLDAHDRLRERLAAAHASLGPSRVRLLDLTPALAGEDRLLQAELSDDGCHTNAAGRAVVRRAMDSLRS